MAPFPNQAVGYCLPSLSQRQAVHSEAALAGGPFLCIKAQRPFYILVLLGFVQIILYNSQKEEEVG